MTEKLCKQCRMTVQHKLKCSFRGQPLTDEAMTEKPPVPSADSLARSYRDRPDKDLKLSLEVFCWLAGYHARDAREERLEGDNRFVQSELMARITELEAEVAELREKLGQAHSEQGHLNNIANNYADESAKAPRRTPELTERVARFLHQKYAQEFETPPFEQLSELEGRGFLHEADEILDLVFGKKEE